MQLLILAEDGAALTAICQDLAVCPDFSGVKLEKKQQSFNIAISAIWYRSSMI